MNLGVLGAAELQAIGDAELLAHQVPPGDLFGDGVLHLQARVDLQEADQPILSHQVLHGASTHVTRSTANGLGGFIYASVLLVRQEWGGCFLHQFLETTLQRAVTRGSNHHVAVLIRQHLSFHVAGAIQVALHETLATAESCGGLTGSGCEEFRDLLHGVGHLHASATTAECSLHRNGQAVFLGECLDFGCILYRFFGSWCQWGIHLGGDVAGGDFVTQLVDSCWWWTDPYQAGILDSLSEIAVFGEESITGVDGIGTGLAGGIKDLLEVEVGLG